MTVSLGRKRVGASDAGVIDLVKERGEGRGLYQLISLSLRLAVVVHERQRQAHAADPNLSGHPQRLLSFNELQPASSLFQEN